MYRVRRIVAPVVVIVPLGYMANTCYKFRPSHQEQSELLQSSSSSISSSSISSSSMTYTQSKAYDISRTILLAPTFLFARTFLSLSSNVHVIDPHNLTDHVNHRNEGDAITIYYNIPL